MTIRNKLMGAGALNVMLLVCVLATSLYVFKTIRQGADQIQDKSGGAVSRSGHAHESIVQIDQNLATLLAKARPLPAACRIPIPD